MGDCLSHVLLITVIQRRLRMNTEKKSTQTKIIVVDKGVKKDMATMDCCAVSSAKSR